MHIDGPYFKDEQGRTLMLRGINLSGSSKIPFDPYLPTHEKFGFYENAKISFVGRPFPLKEADEHFRRLKSWGLTFLRFLVTWEAIEHKAPGEYDENYLEYLQQIIKKAAEYGLKAFIDPHQDVWSRFSGGDGAPRWTFELAGLNVRQFHESGAAVIHHSIEGKLPPMIWPTNYSKLACATMFTLFFGGKVFAPDLKIEEKNIQDYLQEHYFKAFQQVAKAVKGLDVVVGFDTMNEPSPGWIGWEDLNKNEFIIRNGPSPSPFQSMALASGKTMKVENWVIGNRGAKMKGWVDVNPKGIKTWMNGYKCVWKNAGVWDMDKLGNPVLLKPDYFAEVEGKKVDFGQDFLLPFIQQFTKKIRKIISNAIIFAESPVSHPPPLMDTKTSKNMVYAPHWYDAMTLFTKRYRSWLSYDFKSGKVVYGRKKVARLFFSQLQDLKLQSKERMNDAPVVIGEMGIPFDMRSKRSYANHNFSRQIQALNASFKAVEENLLNVTLWNYTPDNSNKFGDLWNEEDLSVFSTDQQTDPQDVNSGGRALPSLIRPYPVKTAGIPLRLNFDIKKGIFEYEFEHDERITDPTEIFVPDFHYPKGYKVILSDGNHELDKDNQLLIYYHSPERFKHSITILKI